MSGTNISITTKSDITIGTTPIVNGADTRILFQNGDLVSESSKLTFDGSLLTFGDTAKIKSTGLYPILYFENSIGQTANIQMYANQLYFSTGASSTVLDNVGLSIGFGGTGASGRLDIKAQGALSTDIVQRWRNSANTANLGKFTGDGAFTIGTYTNPTTLVSFSGNGFTTGVYIGSGTANALYVQNQQGTGTTIAIRVLARQNSGANASTGIKTGANTSGAGSINKGIEAYAYNGVTNYAGYFDSTGGTNNWAIYVQRGDVLLGTATTNKIGFWNVKPIIQPTTGIAAATFVANTSAIINDTATFDGYTLGQVVKALRNMGILA